MGASVPQIVMMTAGIYRLGAGDVVSEETVWLLHHCQLIVEHKETEIMETLPLCLLCAISALAHTLAHTHFLAILLCLGMTALY